MASKPYCRANVVHEKTQSAVDVPIGLLCCRGSRIRKGDHFLSKAILCQYESKVGTLLELIGPHTPQSACTEFEWLRGSPLSTTEFFGTNLPRLVPPTRICRSPQGYTIGLVDGICSEVFRANCGIFVKSRTLSEFIKEVGNSEAEF